MNRILFYVVLLAACTLLAADNRPSAAAIQDDMDTGMSLQQAIVKAVADGKKCPEILAEVSQAVPEIIVVVEAAVKAGLETICVVSWAIQAGGDPKAVADTAVAAGASQEDVRNGLAAGGFPKAQEYVYTPSAPPLFSLGPPSPIAGGVGAGGGGSAASPTVP